MHWSHVGLNCRDQRRTEEYYTRWFGFQRARVVPVGERHIVFLRNRDTYLELFPEGSTTAGAGDADGPASAGCVRHIAFQTADIDDHLAAMGRAAEVTLGPLGFDDVVPGWRTVWLRDPDGVIVEISQGFKDQDGIDIAAAPSTEKDDSLHA